MSRRTQDSEVPQGPNPANLQHLGLHHEKHVPQPLTGLQDTCNVNAPLEHSCASTGGDTQPGHESDMFLRNTFWSSWHNLFNISEICAMT